MFYALMTPQPDSSSHFVTLTHCYAPLLTLSPSSQPSGQAAAPASRPPMLFRWRAPPLSA